MPLLHVPSVCDYFKVVSILYLLVKGKPVAFYASRAYRNLGTKCQISRSYDWYKVLLVRSNSIIYCITRTMCTNSMYIQYYDVERWRD